MAELTFKSAGVSTREIDLSGPRKVGPVGVPAGVIGTALEGPAYVPIKVATFDEFSNTFGATDGEKFGPIAVHEWLRNAQSLVYIRVLGAGDGKKKSSTTGNVTNAGFVVGDQLVQENGMLGDNPWANTATNLGIKGRTYFLGCFMSESNGSTIFSDAGIQGASLAAGAKASCSIQFSGWPTADDELVITDAAGLSRTYTAKESISLADNEYDRDGGSAGSTAASLILCIEHASGHAGSITAVIDGDAGGLTLTQAVGGAAGNTACDASSVDNTTVTGVSPTTANTFTGGINGDHAVPILRGVLLAPSGVILHLSGGTTAVTTKPGDTDTARANELTVHGQKGAMTGAVHLASQEFTMLMNGYAGTTSNLTHVTASFDMTSPSYFPNVFNTDPYQIEARGHFLCASYDVYPDLAAVTGSSAVTEGVYTVGSDSSSQEDIAFLLTSSIARGTVDSTVPMYESFEDRFTHAESPYVISQAYGGSAYDLFKVHALSDGAGISTKFKISIENLNKSTSDTDLFGTFDLLVRRFSDTDDERVVLESFRGLSLDASSDRYIARSIGDQNAFYNFDNDLESQKIVVDGSHPVRSRYIRVQMSNAMKKSEVPDGALPLGFRGPKHLVTSGSLLAGEPDARCYIATDLHKRVREVPIPYRESISQGTGLQKRDDSRLYWGVQSTRKTSATEPNTVGLFDQSLFSFAKHLPNHRDDSTKFWVGDNNGVSNVAGSVLDCDLFNNNKFTLENVKVRTGSDGVADAEYWLSASYVRVGSISADDANKLRAFKVDDLDKVSNRKFAKFTFILQGGFDGTNIFDKDKRELSNAAAKREIDDENQGETAGPTVSAYRKAIDVMSSKTDVELQLLAIPGMRHTSITDYAINATEQRFDAMYIMDIEERDQYNSVITASGGDQMPHVSNTVTAFKNRSLDSSFGAAYFPDVIVTDPTTRALVQVPPTAAVLGAYSVNDRLGHPWFAPAGFTRGALSTVEMASVRLNRTNLDDLYDADINPITAFPGTGVTVWGQKTLLAASSALDRVNVRRLLISVRRKVRNIANTLLFEPNRVETLEKFSALVNPVLQQVQEQSGVDRFKVVIDTTTTTQADVENNTIRGKIFLQPTRAVEFIALDFVVTNAGSEI